ncbi:MAG: thymidine phosphorylase, partial [Clostridia bacterium]|nr:thymidine phosphorylase [Clostridia bacterium]
MSTVDLIIKKREGFALTPTEIDSFVLGASDGSWPDYQVSAMLMAMFLKGLDDRETSDLTLAMARSGRQLDLSGLPGIKVDKHSTGGIADTTTLVVLPLVSACGVPVVKMSGRGLGFTGGTIDKLESIPGFVTGLSTDEAIAQAQAIGAVILAQTDDLTPADKKLYALRDVTGTIESIPLIAASIMSKKIAAGADAIVLDVKCGNGAFMPDLESARALARQMVAIGHQVGRQVVAVISGMDQPLGNLIGNSLEVQEAVDVLQGRVTGDLLEVALTLGSEMLQLAGKALSDQEARELLQRALQSGAAAKKMAEIIKAQGGNPAVVEQLDLLPQAALCHEFLASHPGVLTHIESADLGRALIALGGGRERKGDAIDPAVGLILCKRLGDTVAAGDVLVEILANDPA